MVYKMIIISMIFIMNRNFVIFINNLQFFPFDHIFGKLRLYSTYDSGAFFFLGGGGGGGSPFLSSSGIRPPADPKGPPFELS